MEGFRLGGREGEGDAGRSREGRVSAVWGGRVPGAAPGVGVRPGSVLLGMGRGGRGWETWEEKTITFPPDFQSGTCEENQTHETLNSGCLKAKGVLLRLICMKSKTFLAQIISFSYKSAFQANLKVNPMFVTERRGQF